MDQFGRHERNVDRECESPSLNSWNGESFWTEGFDARQFATGENPETSTTSESIGIDLPGVGNVRPDEISPVCAGRESAVGEVPSGDLAGGVNLAGRERLIWQLVFAGMRLADAQIEPADRTEPAFCTECVVDEHDGAIAHKLECRTGRVHAVIAELIGTLTPTQKETATDGEQPGAGDGIRPHGFCVGGFEAHELICVRCGDRGKEGWLLVAQTSHPLESALRNNQCDVRQGAWSYRYEHECKSIASCEGGAR